MKELTDLIKAIGQANFTSDIVFAFALLLLSFKIDKIIKSYNEKQEKFYELINSILKRQNQLMITLIDFKDDNNDNHKSNGGYYYG